MNNVESKIAQKELDQWIFFINQKKKSPYDI